MLVISRILFGAAFLHFARLAWLNAEQNLPAGDLDNAFYTAICVVLAIANGLVWAPYLGSKMSEPLTSTVMQSTYVEEVNYLMKLARWLARHGGRKPALILCFLEGIRRPHSPAPFLLGFQQSKPGSWLEKVFAREVYRFENIQNCMKAWHSLKSHGITPEVHPNPEVNMAIMAMDRQFSKEVPTYKLSPSAPPPRLGRNHKISLFETEADQSFSEETAREDPLEESSAPAPSEELHSPAPVEPVSIWLKWFNKLAVWRERR